MRAGVEKEGRRCSPECRAETAGLVRTGRSPESLGREFEPSAQPIRRRVKRAELDEVLRSDGLTAEARRELEELRREVRQLRLERWLRGARMRRTGRRNAATRSLRWPILDGGARDAAG